MAGNWNHVHVSEREVAHTWPDGQKDDGHWEDCLWCSIVEWLNETWKDVPDTLAYAEKLRDASGEPPTGGSNFGDVQRAFNKLGIPITLEPKLFATFWSRLDPGTTGVATGSMGNFPAGHRLRRHDTGFTGGHAVQVARVDGTDRVWWCDPLGPKTGYNGEWVTKAELAKFMGATWTGVTRKTLPNPAEDDMIPLVKYLPGYTANIKPESNLRSEPQITTATKVATTGATKVPTSVIGTVVGAKDPANGSTEWYEIWHQGKRLYTAKDNILDLKAPVVSDDGFTKATQDAAVAAATTAATAAEKERIAKAVGTTAADGIRKI